MAIESVIFFFLARALQIQMKFTILQISEFYLVTQFWSDSSLREKYKVYSISTQIHHVNEITVFISCGRLLPYVNCNLHHEAVLGCY